jgi:hypothetical protein
MVGFAAACGMFSSHEGPTQDKIGTAQVSILSVATWDSYMNGLQPQFELTADQALAKVLPSLMGKDDRVLDALQTALRGSVPSTAGAAKSGESKPDEGSLATSGAPEATKEELAGRLRGAKPTGEPPADPVLQYQAAAALFQEVQLLNRYVHDAALRRDATPYVIRLQVTISPLKRELGYDAFTNVSFFPGRDPIKGIVEQFGRGGGGRAAPQGVIPASPTEYASYAAPKGVNVVPLLVTGDLESAMRERREDKLRQYGVALDVLMNGLGPEVDTRKLNEKLRLASGRDSGSVTTVGKVTENTFTIRSGALPTAEEGKEGAAGFSMLAQTHNVTVLILVPNSAERPVDAVHLVARTTFREPGTGLEAPVEDREEWNDALLAIRNTIPWTEPFRLEDFQRLQMWVWTSLYPPFVQDLDAIVRVRLRDELGDSQTAAATWQRIRNDQDSLWAEIASLLVRSRYTLCDVDLPRMVAPTVAADQSALVVDDGVATATVTISGGGGLVRSNLSGFLTLPGGSAGASGPTISATRLELRDGGTTLVLTFPSLQASGLIANPPPAAAGTAGSSSTFLPNASLRIDSLDASSWSSASTSRTIFVSKGVLWSRRSEPKEPAAPGGSRGTVGAEVPGGASPAAAEAPKPFFDLAVGAKVIVADELGHGQIRVAWQLTKPGSIEPPPGKIVFRVEGADLETVSSDPIDAVSSSAGRWLVSQNSSSILTLSNLARNAPVKLVATDEKGSAGTTVEFSVQTPIPRSSKSE